MSKIRSLFLVLTIHFQRIVDHIWRRIVGLPQLKRSEITHELFLGGQYGMRAVSTMKKLGITGIINMRTSGLHDKELKDTFRIQNLPTPDLQAPSIKDLMKGVIFINKELERKGKVYIHCRHGEGRGPTMAIAYLMNNGMKYEDALTSVKTVRTFIKLTSVQIKRLKEFEKLLTKNAA